MEHDWIIPSEIGLMQQIEELYLTHSFEKYDFIIHPDIGKLTQLKTFGHINDVSNADEVQNVLPKSCKVL